MRRVVVTGMGILSPLGIGVEHNWKRLVRGDQGVRRIEHFEVDELDSKIAGIIPKGEGEGEYNEEALFGRRERSRNDRFILYSLATTEEALQDAGWKPEDEEALERTGVILGSGVGGFSTITAGALDFAERGQKAISPFFIPAQVINLASGQVAIKYGFKGPNYSVVSACSTGADSVSSGARAIQLDEADVVITGGSDAVVHPLAIAGFCRAKAMSTGYNDTPEKASRPFDTGRDGFVIAEGAGVLILEELEHAKKRGATIYAEVLGFSSASDAYHITATAPDGNGERRALTLALDRAKVDPGDVDYVNAHATSTPVGDVGELAALSTIFKGNENLAISSTKSSVGHTLGAAGAIESIYSICTINRGLVPPTLNLENKEPGYDHLNLVPNEAQEKKVDIAVSNAFGFGSTKSTLVYSKFNG